jgi:hypothetical protein
MNLWLQRWKERFLGTENWKPQWQKALADAVKEAQRGLAVNMVVIVARESDIYSELLFIFSFLGLSMGAIIAYLLRSVGLAPEDLLVFPLLGFSLGATIYTFRRFYLQNLVARAIKERVFAKAKGHFFDHSHNLQGKLALVYFSEIEKEAVLLTSPELNAYIKEEEIQSALSEWLRFYDLKNPLKTVGPALLKIGTSLRTHLPQRLAPMEPGPATSRVKYLGGSDRAQTLKIPILKGTKEIN